MTVDLSLVLAGLAAVVAVNLVADRTGQPPAVLLVVAGLLYALLPGRNLQLRPDLVLALVIPPLLYATALGSSTVALRASARTVVNLSVGLVVVTALVVGAVLYAVVPALPLAAAIALGAAVAPPDPVAALAIGRRAGLPPRLLTVIEGEGLLNDATALVLLEEAVSVAVRGRFSIGEMLVRFLLTAVGGVAVGLVVGIVTGWLRRLVAEPLGENVLSLAAPFVASLFAGAIHASAVLAVVVAGLWSAHHSPTTQSGPSRLQTRAVWRLAEYLLEGFVFLLIGQQLPSLLRGLRAYPVTTVVGATAATVGTVLLVRPVWLVVTSRLRSVLTRTRGAGRDSHAWSRRELLALSWTGTRGVITLAAAFALPLTVRSGATFPRRDLLLFLAYVVVLVTLIGQGLSFAPLVRRLGLGDSQVAAALMRNQARIAAVKAAMEWLREAAVTRGLPDDVVATLRDSAQSRLERYEGRVSRLSGVEQGGVAVDDPYVVAAQLRRAMIDAERQVILEWRDSGRLPESSLRILQRELDHEEGLLPG